MADQQNPPPVVGQAGAAPVLAPAPAPPEPIPGPPAKIEIDSATYVKGKKGLRLMTNFVFSVKAHSILNDKEGNRIYLLYCGTQEGRVFKVPITVDETDTLQKITSKISRFKTGFDAVIHAEEAKFARLHSMVRAEIDEYKSKDARDKVEVIVCGEFGRKNVEGIGEVYILGPSQIISVSGDTETERKLALKEIFWMGDPNVEDLRIHGHPFTNTVVDFLSQLERYHTVNAGSAFALIGHVYLSLHVKEISPTSLILPSFILAGKMQTGNYDFIILQFTYN